MEKDLWVCVVLDVIFNGLPDGHPRLLFKGGTSLSKVFGLIDRFSEDIDLVVYRDGLGFEGDRDPTSAESLSKARSALDPNQIGGVTAFIQDELHDSSLDVGNIRVLSPRLARWLNHES